MEQTAMKLLLEYIEEMEKLDDIINPIEIMKRRAEHLLEKERRQIIYAFDKGVTKGILTDGGVRELKLTPEQYFTKTYQP